MNMLHNRVETKQIRATKNQEIVEKSIVIEWTISKIIPKESLKKGQGNAPGNPEETAENHLEMTLATLRDDPEITDEQRGEKPGMTPATCARLWRRKATARAFCLNFVRECLVSAHC